MPSRVVTGRKMLKFSSSELFKLRHSLVGVVEELKFRKKYDLENETKIQDLVNKNHILQRSLDSEQQSTRLKEEGFEKAIDDVRQQYETRLRRYEIEQRQKDIGTQSRLHVEGKMKEQIRQLQMTVFQQEKTIKELETKLQTQESSSQNTLSQWVGVEKRISALAEIYQSTQESVSRLERDVKEAVVLNKKLSFLSQHHRCEMIDKCSEISRLREEILNVRVRVSSQPVEVFELQEMRGTVNRLNHKIKCLDEEIEKLREELVLQCDQAKQAMTSAKIAHTLVNRHLENATRCRAETEKFAKDCQILTAQYNETKIQLRVSEENLQQQTLSMKNATIEWEQKESQLEEERRVHCLQLQTLEDKKKHLEELTSQLTQRNEELTQLLDHANAKLDVAKSDTEVQAGSSFFHCYHRILQAAPDLITVGTQSSQPETMARMSQTDHHDIVSSVVQTDQVIQNCTEVQTSPSCVSSCDEHQEHAQSTPTAIADLCMLSTKSGQKQQYNDHTFNSHRGFALLQVKNEVMDCNRSSFVRLENNGEIAVSKDGGGLGHSDISQCFSAPDGLNSVGSHSITTGSLQHFCTNSTTGRHSTCNKSKSINRVHSSDSLYTADGNTSVSSIDSSEMKLEVGANDDTKNICFSKPFQQMGSDQPVSCMETAAVNTCTDAISKTKNKSAVVPYNRENVSMVDIKSDPYLTADYNIDNSNYEETDQRPSKKPALFHCAESVCFSDKFQKTNTFDENSEISAELKNTSMNILTATSNSIVLKPLPDINTTDVAHSDIRKRSLVHEPSIPSQTCKDSINPRVVDRAPVITRKDTVTTETMKKSLRLLRMHEQGCNIWRKSDFPERRLSAMQPSVYILNLDLQTSFSANYKITYEKDGTAVIKVSDKQRRMGQDIDQNVVRRDQSSYKSSNSIYVDKIIKIRTGSEIKNVMQVSSSSVSKPVPNKESTDFFYANQEKGFPMNIEKPDQNLLSVPSHRCKDPYCFHTAENRATTCSEMVISRHQKRPQHSLKHTKPGNVLKKAMRPSSDSLFSQIVSEKVSRSVAAKSSEHLSVVMADLATKKDSVVDTHKPLLSASSCLQSSVVHQAKEQLEYQSLSNDRLSNFSKFQKHVSSLTATSTITTMCTSQPSPDSLDTSHRVSQRSAKTVSQSVFDCESHNTHSLASCTLDFQYEGTNQQRKCSGLDMCVMTESEKSPRTRHRSRGYEVLVPPSSRTKSTPTKRKGILKGPRCDKMKSVTSKSVTFPLELEHHQKHQGHVDQTKICQQKDTSTASDARSLTDCQTHHVDTVASNGQVICPSNKESVFGIYPSSSNPSSHLSLTPSGSPTQTIGLISQASCGAVTKPCFMVPETPNLDVSESESELICSPFRGATFPESLDISSHVTERSLFYGGHAGHTKSHGITEDIEGPSLKKHKK